MLVFFRLAKNHSRPADDDDRYQEAQALAPTGVFRARFRAQWVALGASIPQSHDAFSGRQRGIAIVTRVSDRVYNDA
jgi:hypothetical protein